MSEFVIFRDEFADERRSKKHRSEKKEKGKDKKSHKHRSDKGTPFVCISIWFVFFF